MRLERRSLSVLRSFVPAHFLCAYDFTETTRNRLLCNTTPVIGVSILRMGFIFKWKQCSPIRRQP